VTSPDIRKMNKTEINNNLFLIPYLLWMKVDIS